MLEPVMSRHQQCGNCHKYQQFEYWYMMREICNDRMQHQGKKFEQKQKRYNAHEGY